jgi:hypothetical protein
MGHPRCESGESESGTHEVRVHAVLLGGRYRLDALRVFSTGRSQDLLVIIERALARKKSVASPDARRGWTEGERVRVSSGSFKSFRTHGLWVSACRFSIR